MKEAIETRELIALHDSTVAVRGTYHKPCDERFHSLPAEIRRDRVGVIFLNPWYPTRAWKGDSAVYWADSFAELGYPCFRLDMPGCGDSEGDLPADLVNFINTGGYASIIAGKIKELTVRFNLSGIVMVGLCAGAVSAIYAAAASPECKGIVLMDPFFNLPVAPRSEAREELSARVAEYRLGRLAIKTYHRIMALRLLLLGDQPPQNTNFPLLKRWKELESTGLPILVLESRIPRGVEFDYVRYNGARADGNGRVTVRLIEGAYHTFTDAIGRAGVLQNTESWLNALFPLRKNEDVPANASGLQVVEKTYV